MALNSESPESLNVLAGILVAEQSLEATLLQVLELACDAIDGADQGVVTLWEREGPITATATNDDAKRVDAVQYEVGSGGPCLDAFRHQVVNRIASTATDERWPEFAAAAAEAGVLSTLSLPLVVSGEGLGVLNLYCGHVEGFSAADDTIGAAFASFASVALANAQVYWRVQTLAAQLQEAMSTRGVIDQAKGILMAAQGCSADEAFDLLVRASQRSHTKLRDVATGLADRARERAKGPDQ